MSILLKKGAPYSAYYTSTDYPILTAASVGTIALYTTYPGTEVFSKAMTRDTNRMLIELTLAEILALPAGSYCVVSSITPVVGGETVTMMEYATVVDATVFTTPMTKLSLTMAKTDATPAGKQTRTMTNTISGTTIVLGWEGLKLTVSNAEAAKLSSSVISTETVSTTTNQAGYAEIYVVKGLTYTVTCPGFGKPLTVDTTGLDEIDLSTYF